MRPKVVAAWLVLVPLVGANLAAYAGFGPPPPWLAIVGTAAFTLGLLLRAWVRPRSGWFAAAAGVWLLWLLLTSSGRLGTNHAVDMAIAALTVLGHRARFMAAGHPRLAAACTVVGIAVPAMIFGGAPYVRYMADYGDDLSRAIVVMATARATGTLAWFAVLLHEGLGGRLPATAPTARPRATGEPPRT